QKTDVLKVLAALGVETEGDRKIIEVLNKIDLLDADVRAGLATRTGTNSAGPVAISALTGEGLNALLTRISDALGAGETLFDISIDTTDGAGLAWVYEHGRVLQRHEKGRNIRLEVAADPGDADRFL